MENELNSLLLFLKSQNISHPRVCKLGTHINKAILSFVLPLFYFFTLILLILVH